MTAVNELLLAGFVERSEGLRHSERTISRDRYIVRLFLSWLGDLDIREADEKLISAWREHLATRQSVFTGRGLAGVTIQSYLVVLKSFFEYLYLNEKIIKNPLEGIVLLRKGARKQRKIFSEDEIALLLDCIDGTDANEERDRALLELMYSSGLRAGEALSLECGEVKLDERVLLVRQGKGKKDRYVPFSETALVFIRRYMGRGRKEHARRCRNRAVKRLLFLGEPRGLCYSSLRECFVKYLQRCGLEGKGYTMHSIRHACATHLLAHGAGIRYVQELLGHESLSTTQTYTRPGEENIKAVYRTFHPRENEYFREIGEEYRAQLKELKARVLWGLRVAKQYRETGHTKGFGRWKKGSFPHEEKSV